MRQSVNDSQRGRWYALSLNGVKDVPQVLPYLTDFTYWCPGLFRFKSRGHTLVRYYDLLYVTYILVRATEPEIYALEDVFCSERRSFRFLRTPDKNLCVIKASDVERMQKAEKAAKRAASSKRSYAKGEKVTLRSGIFSGYTGKVLSHKNNQAIVLVEDIMQSLFLVAIHDMAKYHILEPAEQPKEA